MALSCVVASFVTAAVFVACSRGEVSEEAPASVAARASRHVDTPVGPPVWLEGVKKAHSDADAARSPSEQKTAVEELATSFSAVPSDGDPKTLALRQDLAARAAGLSLSLGDARGARDWAVRGLALSDGRTVLRAQLLLMRADAERALGDTAASGDLLVEALGINQDLLERELETP